MYTIVGLGNPGEEYADTHHNAGRIILELIAKKEAFSPWKEDMKLKALIATGMLGKIKVRFVLPNNFMNNSGGSVAPLITSSKELERLVVIYDDLDIALGGMKISYDRSSGGHNGLESIIKKVKSQKFARIRVGICPTTPGGKLRRPPTGDNQKDFLLKGLREKELAEIKKLSKKITEALTCLINESREKAMSLYN